MPLCMDVKISNADYGDVFTVRGIRTFNDLPIPAQIITINEWNKTSIKMKD